MNALNTYKLVNKLDNKAVAQELGVSTLLVARMCNRELTKLEELAIVGLTRSKDRVSHFVSVEVKYGASRITASREGRDRKQFSRDYSLNWSDDAVRIAREYANMTFDNPPSSISGTGISKGDLYVFTLEF